MTEATKTISAVIENTSLVKGLFILAQQKFTGMVKVGIQVTETKKQLQCFLFFQDGLIAFAERNNLSSQEFVAAIARRLKLGCFDSIMEYVSNRINIKEASVGEILETIVTTRAISWADIERVITDRIVILLEEFLSYACTIQVVNQRDLGITYSNNRRGINCSEILQRIGERQKYWRKYLPILHSIYAIPRINNGSLQAVDHQPTKQHLLQWADGRRSFAEIAEALDQDPITLAPLYCRWKNEKLIDFSFGLCDFTNNQPLPIILSVDDSPIVQAMIRRDLCENYEVISASSALEALNVLNRQDVNLILLDVTMPEIDGFEFCRTIRKIKKFKDIPVIMLTAKDGLIDRAMGHMAGTNRYLTKPVDKDELIKAIQEFI